MARAHLAGDCGRHPDKLPIDRIIERRSLGTKPGLREELERDDQAFPYRDRL